MKTSKLIAGSLLLSIAAFMGCQNCDEAVKNVQAAADGRITSITDSLQGAWKADVDAVRASYDARIKALQDSIAALNAEMEAKKGATPAKKPTTTTAPKTEAEIIIEKKKEKMKGD